MNTLIEVFRNVPAGKGCLSLTKNVLDLVCEKQGDFEIRFISFPSEVANERGIERAPSIMINRKVSAYGILTKDEIEILIAKGVHRTIGIILTKSPLESEDALAALTIANNALRMGDSIEIFLLGDGVWIAKTDLKGAVSDLLSKFLLRKGGLMVSGPHIRAGGLDRQRIVGRAEIVEKPYDRLVDLTMTKWDKVISF